MITRAILENVFGTGAEAVESYLDHKNTGGLNNAKGNVFESHFAVYKIANLIAGLPSEANTSLSSQLRCFIDDLVVKRVHVNSDEYYQIKDINQLSWNSLPHKLSDDVLYQDLVCRAIGIEAKYHIVVSLKAVYESLSTSIPPDIAHLVEVVHFPGSTSINNLIRSNDALRESLIKICAFSDPETDKLDTLGSIILGAWISTDQRKVSIETLYQRCLNSSPNFFRRTDRDISLALRQKLDGTAGFSFYVTGGYLAWNYLTTDKGFVPYVIGSDAFSEWERGILEIKGEPDFLTIEPYLL